MATYSPCLADLHQSQFTIETRELDVCALQGPSLPRGDLIHPLLGHEVIIAKGPSKGYRGRIKYVGCVAVTVELEAWVVGSNLAIQVFQWAELKPR
jgi:hypothetical protein